MGRRRLQTRFSAAEDCLGFWSVKRVELAARDRRKVVQNAGSGFRSTVGLAGQHHHAEVRGDAAHLGPQRGDRLAGTDEKGGVAEAGMLRRGAGVLRRSSRGWVWNDADGASLSLHVQHIGG